MSCFKVAALCIGDSVCNKHLAVLMKSCPVNGNTCIVKDCHKTMRSFYETMPFNVSQMLAFCYCDQFNEDCQRAGEVLHSRSCTATTDILVPCVRVVNSCLENDLCRLVKSEPLNYPLLYQPVIPLNYQIVFQFSVV